MTIAPPDFTPTQLVCQRSLISARIGNLLANLPRDAKGNCMFPGNTSGQLQEWQNERARINGELGELNLVGGKDTEGSKVEMTYEQLHAWSL